MHVLEDFSRGYQRAQSGSLAARHPLGSASRACIRPGARTCSADVSPSTGGGSHENDCPAQARRLAWRSPTTYWRSSIPPSRKLPLHFHREQRAWNALLNRAQSLEYDTGLAVIFITIWLSMVLETSRRRDMSRCSFAGMPSARLWKITSSKFRIMCWQRASYPAGTGRLSRPVGEL